MIIVRSPLRITLGGGGTDLPSHYRKYGGSVLSAAIDKYVYITIHQTFVEDLIVKYSALERVQKAFELQHPIFREVFKLLNLDGQSMEVSSMADIPSGTGLGSSSSFTTALLKALHAYKREHIQSRDLAEEACYIEMDVLQEPIGKQDQYAAAFGGINRLNIDKNGAVVVDSLSMSQQVIFTLEENLLLFFTGYTRSASQLLKQQNDLSLSEDKRMEANLLQVQAVADRTAAAVAKGDMSTFAALLNYQWFLKKQRQYHNSDNETIDKWVTIGLHNGALGGKVVGAGGGGFILFYAHDPLMLRNIMCKEGLKEVRFKFDFEGTKTIING